MWGRGGEGPGAGGDSPGDGEEGRGRVHPREASRRIYAAAATCRGSDTALLLPLCARRR